MSWYDEGEDGEIQDYEMEMVNLLLTDVQCCAVNCLKHLGEETYGGEKNIPHATSVVEFLEKIRQAERDMCTGLGQGYAVKKTPILMAITNHNQPLAEAALQEIGFDRSGPYDEERKVSVWIIQNDKFMKRYEEITGKDWS